jgi:hypothetical protein
MITVFGERGNRLAWENDDVVWNGKAHGFLNASTRMRAHNLANGIGVAAEAAADRSETGPPRRNRRGTMG